MMTSNEIIEMLNVLKRSRRAFSGSDTIILNVNPDSFKFVIDETIIKINQLEKIIYDEQQKKDEASSEIYKTLERMFQNNIE